MHHRQLHAAHQDTASRPEPRPARTADAQDRMGNDEVQRMLADTLPPDDRQARARHTLATWADQLGAGLFGTLTPDPVH